jgi:ABC-type nitrate/sulfonate/bicarbonate transport system substrate-binding protein
MPIGISPRSGSSTKKYGLDVELIFIPSSTTTISAVVSGSAAVGNISGGSTAIAAVGGAGVSRRVEARAGQRRVDSPSRRVDRKSGAFRTGRIIAFPAPPGVIHLTHDMQHRILASTADFPKGFPFPYVCPTASKSL